MATARPGSRFWPWTKPSPAPVEPDPADLGTAFGLDMSLRELDDTPVPPPRKSGADRPPPSR